MSATKPTRNFIIQNGYKSDQYNKAKEVSSRSDTVSSIKGSPFEYRVGYHKVYSCEGFYYCDCPDFEELPKNCKHILALKKYLHDPVFEKIEKNSAELSDKKMSSKDLLDDIVQQLSKKYSNSALYSLTELESDNPRLNVNRLNSLCKRVVGKTARQYLGSLGIIKDQIAFDYQIDLVTAKDLYGKAVCVAIDPENSIKDYIGVLQQAGATIVPPDAKKIDYLCLILTRSHYTIMKEPADQNKTAFSLMSQLEKHERTFSVINETVLSRIQRQFILEKLFSPEERASMGLTASNLYVDEVYAQNPLIHVVNKISEDSIPKISENEFYWTLGDLRENCDFQGGNIRFPEAADYCDTTQKNDFSAINEELSNYTLLCHNVTNPEIAQAIIDNAVKTKDGWLHRGKVQYVAAFKYTQYSTKYYAIAARNISKDTIEITQGLYGLDNPGDTDYVYNDKLDDHLDGVSPAFLNAILYSDEESTFAHRNMPGYLFIDSKSGIIPEGAFANDPLIRYVEFSNNVKEIGMRAFYNCPNLKCVKIGKNVTVLDDSAFQNCVTLESVFLDYKLSRIGNSCFCNCYELFTVDFGAHSICREIGYSAFAKCDKLSTITIPSSVKSIANTAFDETTNRVLIKPTST